MLYENEVVRLYDPETGLEAEELIEKKQDAEIGELIEEGRKLKSLRDSQGWKILEDWLKQAITTYKDILVYEQDTTKVLRLQEAVKSYTNVLQFVEQKIREAEVFERERTLSQEANPKE